jgi:hypothetical protein
LTISLKIVNHRSYHSNSSTGRLLSISHTAAVALTYLRQCRQTQGGAPVAPDLLAQRRGYMLLPGTRRSAFCRHPAQQTRAAKRMSLCCFTWTLAHVLTLLPPTKLPSALARLLLHPVAEARAAFHCSTRALPRQLRLPAASHPPTRIDARTHTSTQSQAHRCTARSNIESPHR